VFRKLLVGGHEVEIRKDGYASKKERVTIAEGQTYALSGSLEPSSASQTTSSVSSSPGSAIETITVNGVSFNMVRVDGGTFQMGATSEQQNPDSDEKPVHRVTLSDYYIGETEVTQGLWEAVMGSNPSNFKGSNLPVERVSWDDSQAFIRKLNQLTGRRFRLPTEAEWEYAARGGNRSRGYQYGGSNTLTDVAWYYDNSKDKTHDVKTKQSNELGLYDMSGNVWEWCQDWYGDYSSSAQTNPTGPSSGSSRVGRGGCWSSDAWCCRVSTRINYSPGNANYYLGLRLAL
jgi:formylglycine-generating enzyme required for sulfatase activity